MATIHDVVHGSSVAIPIRRGAGEILEKKNLRREIVAIKSHGPA